MEISKKEVHNYTWKAKNAMQFTIDDTINLEDNLMDVERLVLVKGNVVVDEIQPMVDRFQIKGHLNYQILYCGNEQMQAFDSMKGGIPFVEYVNADGTNQKDYIEVHACLNDLSVTMLHSRKLSVKALVGIDYQVNSNETFEVITDLDETDINVLRQDMSMMNLGVQDHQMLRVEDQVEIPANKPDVYQVAWKSMSVTSVSIKPMDGCVMISGVLNVFFVYTAKDEGMPLQYFTLEVPFERQLDVRDASEDMISGSFVNLNQYHISVVANEMGEDRIVNLCADFATEIKLYDSVNMSLVKDAYSIGEELRLEWKTFNVQHLLVRNCAKMKINEKLDMPKNHTILQSCNVEGSVSIDDTKTTAKGIYVEGIVGSQLTYMNKSDGGNISSATFDIPFGYEIEINGMQENVTYSIVPFLERITAMLMDDTSIELKAEVSLEVLAFTNEQIWAVQSIEICEIDYSKKRTSPSMIGYVVKKDDTLWSVAKTYYTTMEHIKEINELEGDELSVGQKLIIQKE